MVTITMNNYLKLQIFLAILSLLGIRLASANSSYFQRLQTEAGSDFYSVRLAQVDRYYQELEHLIYGDNSSCEGLGGIYQLTADEGITETLIATIVPRNQIWFLLRPEYKIVLQLNQYDLNEREWGKFLGLLILVEEGWFLVKVDQPGKAPYHALYLSIGTEPAFAKTLDQERKETPGVQISKVQFNRERTKGSAENLTFTLLERASLAAFLDFYDRTSANIEPLISRDSEDSFTSAYIPFYPRVPQKITQLSMDQDYTNLLAAGDYLQATDYLFAKSRDFADGDLTIALYTSFLATYMHSRGSCGAINGLRGRGLVMPSIFSQEKFNGSVIRTRWDAPQHFFGNAFLAHFINRPVAWLAFSLRDLIDFHAPETKACDFVRRVSEHDSETDALYDSMGRHFAKLLSRDKSALPSTAIKDKRFDEAKETLGIQSGDEPWTMVADAYIVPLAVEKNSEDFSFTYKVSPLWDCGAVLADFSVWAGDKLLNECARIDLDLSHIHYGASGHSGYDTNILKLHGHCREYIDNPDLRLMYSANGIPRITTWLNPHLRTSE